MSISFANVKGTDLEGTIRSMKQIIEDVYNKNVFLLESGYLTENDKVYFRSVTNDMEETTAVWALHKMSDFLSRYHGKKVLILLDEYDTPMQEAYVNGYWDGLIPFIRSLFNATFKTNPYLGRAVMTGITRVRRESFFSDLNNLKVVTVTSDQYADSFGFTEEEVFRSLDEFGLSERKEDVKSWYDGFIFGKRTDIYNPWSIINYLDTGKFAAYWVNTSSNDLVSKLIQEGGRDIKQKFEKLLSGGLICAEIDEQIVYDQLNDNEEAIWSLLLASGYLKALDVRTYTSELGRWIQEYELTLTNFEVRAMFHNMIHRWFGRAASGYNDFIRALLADDVRAMNLYMNDVAMTTFSYFDTGKNPSRTEPERFYHGFVLGLMVDLSDRYILTSNRESGFGRYDVVLEPRNPREDAVILEFKVQDIEKETELSDTAKDALDQIERQNYTAVLTAKGIPEEHIRKYGFAFCGKTVLISGGICR